MQKTRSDECLNRVKHWQLRTNGNLVRQILQRDLQLVALIVSEVANESLVDRLVAPELLAWGEALRLGATLALQGVLVHLVVQVLQKRKDDEPLPWLQLVAFPIHPDARLRLDVFQGGRGCCLCHDLGGRARARIKELKAALADARGHT